MPTHELLFSAVALLGVAFSSTALLSCKRDEARPEPVGSAPAPLDPNDPEALRRAAAVVATWNEKDPALTAKILLDAGIVVTDPATFKAMAEAQSRWEAFHDGAAGGPKPRPPAEAVASASASAAAAAPPPHIRKAATPQPPPDSSSRILAPMA